MTGIDQPTARPTNKVTAGVVGGALSVVIVWLIGDVPPHVAVAFSTIFSFGLAYFVRD